MEGSNEEQNILDETESQAKIFDLCRELGIIIPDTVSKVANYDPLGPKLMIYQIENENFKSYAGKQMLGPFHKNFTSIVGPNGSGKSNVIDSMLFVFGFRAAKIRSKKISVLIHNSSRHNNINNCTVKVYFHKIIDNPISEDQENLSKISDIKKYENYKVVPNSEFVISRTAFKDNSSYYCINGKKSTYKDISDILRSHGIDLDHNRFLILQGEVELISLMKPKSPNENEDGMLEFLEDIIGSNRFKEPLIQLNDIISEQTEKRGEKLSRFKAIEKELETLEGPKKEACYFLEKENEITIVKNRLLQISKMNLQSTIEDHNQKYKVINDRLNLLKDLIQSCLLKKKEIESKYKSQKKIFETLYNEQERHQQKMREYDVVDAKVREDFKHNDAKNVTLAKNIEQEKQKIQEFIHTYERNQEYLDSNIAELERLSKTKDEADLELQKAFEDLKQNTASLQKQKEGKETLLLEREKEYIPAKANLDRINGQLKLYLGQYNSNRDKIADVTERIKAMSASFDETKAKLEELVRFTLPKFETQSNSMKADIENLKKSEKELTNELRVKRLKIDMTKSAMATSNTHRSKLLSALLEAKAQGILPGIFGRLGDLGGIDAKYDTAISSCCGALENIVVDNVDTAQACVRFLKERKLGSTTFVALSEVEKKWSSSCMAPTRPFPENVPRLYDLVRPVSPALAPAFYFSLRDSLVASDLDQATRVAYNSGPKRYRVVTLSGEVIELVGTLSGGGGKPIKGRMGTHPIVGKESYSRSSESDLEEISDAKQVTKLESDCDKLINQLEIVRNDLSSKENALKAIQASITPSLMNQTKWTMDTSSYEVQLQTMRSQLDVLTSTKQKTVPDATKIAEMERDIKKLQEIHDRCFTASENIRKEIGKITQQIKVITDKTVTSQQVKVNNLVDTISKLTREVTKMEAERETCLKNKVKAETKIENMIKETEKNKAIIVECEAKMKELEILACEVMDKMEEKKDEIVSLQKELNTMHGLIEEIDKDENAAKSEILTLTHEFGVQKNRVMQNEAELEKILSEIRGLKLNVIPSLNSRDKNDQSKDDVVDLPNLTREDLAEANVDHEKAHLKTLQTEIAGLKPNLSIIQEYLDKESQYIGQAKDLDSLTSTRKATQDLYNDLKYQRLNEFLSGFTLITVRLKEIYRMITLGGDADLELVDSLDPFTEGVAFKVRPLNKSWKNVNNLSGGEKTLSSIALIFALHHFKPTPFYIMDEIDAALDFKNVSIVANYIKLRTQSAQFIIISLRHNMFELADRLIGIYKTNDCTKNVVFQPRSLYHLDKGAEKGGVERMEEEEGVPGDVIPENDKSERNEAAAYPEHLVS